MELAPRGSELGNTKSSSTRISAAKNWTFTLYPDETTNEKAFMDDLNRLGKYLYEHEKCPDTGRLHYQGFITFDKKQRPKECLKNWPTIHWEKQKATDKQNIKYCTKDNDNIRTNRDDYIDDPLKGKTLHSWEKEIIDILSGRPDDRKIYWRWGTGNIGKSTFAKHLAIKYNALILTGGKRNDLLYIVSNTESKKIIVFDIPRDRLGYLPYGTIEEIKNGLFTVSKYESKTFLMNIPHIVILANSPPDEEELKKWSEDRWDIKNI